jgi:hypothetical protein
MGGRSRNRASPDIVRRAMQSATMSRSIVLGGIFGLVLTVVALAGCSSGVTVPLPGTEPLVTVQMRGGMCPEGACDQTITLERDGRVHSATKPPNELGRVRADALAALDAAIRTADYTAMRGHPFTGQCPIAFDGQELIFEFGAPGGTQRIASCEVDIDWGSPLFVGVGVALGAFIPMPLS